MDAKNIFTFLTGIVVVPLGFLMNALYPWWVRASLPLKIITGPIILPLTAIIYGLVTLWKRLT